MCSPAPVLLDPYWEARLSLPHRGDGCSTSSMLNSKLKSRTDSSSAPAGGVLILLVIFIFPANATPLQLSYKDLQRVDWIGGWLSLAAITLLIFALQSGGSEYEWNSAPVVSTLVGAGTCLVLFLLYEAFLGRGSKDDQTLPLYPTRLFKNWRLNAALLLVCPRTCINLT